MSKKEILTLIIGILIGVIITTVVFLCIKQNDKSSFDKSSGFEQRQDMSGSMPEIGDGQKSDRKDKNATTDGATNSTSANTL